MRTKKAVARPYTFSQDVSPAMHWLFNQYQVVGVLPHDTYAVKVTLRHHYQPEVISVREIITRDILDPFQRLLREAPSREVLARFLRDKMNLLIPYHDLNLDLYMIFIAELNQVIAMPPEYYYALFIPDSLTAATL